MVEPLLRTVKPPARQGRSDSPYDDAVAASYERLALPHVFAAPARDLVALVSIPEGASVLDVGCGTGAVALPASEALGARGRVVALDPSLAMLRVLRAKAPRRCAPVHGIVPGLPFGDARFGFVLASFVLSHVADLRSALADIARVLSRRGRLGASAWGSYDNPFADAWKEVGRGFVRTEAFEQALRELLPWDERFSREGNLARALEDAGFAQVAVERREYGVRLGLAEFLELREYSLEGQLLLRMMAGERRAEWRRRVSEELWRRFGERIEYSRPALLATGRKR